MLFDEDGEKVGVVGLPEALNRANDKELDLMQVSEADGVAICKIVNYDSFQYHEQKKKHKQETRNKSHQIKEMRFRAVIGEHDMQVKVAKCAEMLEEGHKVKIVLLLRGRELANRDRCNDIANKIIETLREFAEIDVAPKDDAKGMSFTMRPEKKLVQKIKM